MTELDLPDDVLDDIDEVLDALSQGYGIGAPSEDLQEQWLETYRTFKRARRGEPAGGEVPDSTDDPSDDPDDFDFDIDDIT